MAYSYFSTNQVTVGATATLIVAAHAGRKNALIINEGSVDIRIGNSSSVTLNNGVLLSGGKGANLMIEGGGTVYGIVASGSEAVSFIEVFF